MQVYEATERAYKNGYEQGKRDAVKSLTDGKATVTTHSKRFEDWEEVNCNECARYWDSSCDGVSKDSKKLCNSFLAIRSVVIPARLDALEKRVKFLAITRLIGDVGVLLFMIAHFLRWL